MIKIATFTLVLATLFNLNVGTVYAQIQPNSSAVLKSEAEGADFDYRTENLRKFLERYDSPLSVYASEFITNADANGLDYRLVPAITGVESTFGKRIPYNSYNAYGWANGEYRFTSWANSIEHVSETLKTSYIEKGAPTIAKIARRYAPPSTTWGNGVRFFVGKIDTLPLDFDII